MPKAVTNTIRGVKPRPWKLSLEKYIKFPQLPHASPDPILITNAKGIIYYVNPAWEKLTGYTFKEVEGQNPRILNSGKTPKRIYKKLWQALYIGKSFSSDDIYDRRKNGTEYQIHSTFFLSERAIKIFFMSRYNTILLSLKPLKKHCKKVKKDTACCSIMPLMQF